MKKYFVVIFLVLFSLNIFAQGESFGYTTSNYSGVNSVLLNPSAMHNQNVWLSFNFLSGNLFFHTDFAYLDKSEFRLTDLLDPNFEFQMHPDGYGDGERPFYSFDSQKNTSLDQSMRFLGPSLMFSYNQHAFAITTAARSQINVRNLSPDMANILTYGISYFPQYGKEFQVENFSGTSMAWAEIGLSYAYRLNKKPYRDWSFGISLKRLLGAGGAYMNVNESTYFLSDTLTVDIINQQAEIGISAPIDFDTNEFINYNLLNGRGWVMDIGFTYQSLINRQPKLNASRFCEQPITNYKYRIGVAILDIGSISYNQNAQTHEFTNSTQALGDLSGIVLNNVNQVFELMSDRFYGSPTESFVDNSMRIALPMALSVQADYNTQFANFYWNASLIYGIPLQGGALRRPNQLTIAPRYETKFLELSVPLSFYQFQYPHLGIYGRVGSFSIGSDWLSTLLGNRDFNGFDFYFSVKFQLAKQSCRSRKLIKDACNN